jgi:hypothetical protein
MGMDEDDDEYDEYIDVGKDGNGRLRGWSVWMGGCRLGSCFCGGFRMG